VYGCGGLYALSLLLTVVSGGTLMGGSVFNMLGPNGKAVETLGVSGAGPVFFQGRWWTVLSAGWLHGGALHILFNMMWVRQLGPIVADMYGGARMVIIYTLASICGFLLSSVLAAFVPIPLLSGGYYTLGASAAIFGLLGSLLHYGRRGGSSIVRTQAMSWAIPVFLFGFFMPGVDNAAHLGGFAGGYLASMWLDPLKPERMDHFVGAALCLIATALAIAASLFLSLPDLLRVSGNG